MDYLHKKNFDFVSHALPANTFGVVRFRGSEGFSMCYEFEIDLVSKDAEVDLTTVLKNPVTFTILREDGDIPFNGILAQFEQLHEVDEHIFYRAVLVPKLWWLSLTHHNQVVLNKTVPKIIEEVLKDGGLTSLDFEFKLQKDYPQWEYICQYRESHLSFVSRWMEREGMYYYFEQTPQGEKVIITDTKIAHTDMSEGRTMYYSPTSGLDEPHREEVMKAFVCRQKMLPRTLNLKDYNYMKPSMEISGKADVSPDGRGNIYMYGNHFRTAKEGDALAKIRAEELLCQERRFHGDSTIPYLRPGYLFDLEDHYRNDFNQKYLTVDLEHEGSQTAFLLSGIQKGLSEVEEQPYYRNSFMAIPAGVQYRHESNTEKARFYGTMNARVDAAGSGKYAEVDEHGRYKIVLPFDVSGRKDGKASAYFRMAQPYAGSDHGMHFPLHKGTEVLLTFTDGDPDRPIIQGAVPNPETPSVIGSANATGAGIKTAGGNQIVMQDHEGSQRISLHSGDGKARFICGSGSPSSIVSESDFNATYARGWGYYATQSGMSLATSGGWSAAGGGMLPAATLNFFEAWSNDLTKQDELGHKVGAYKASGSKRGEAWQATMQLLGIKVVDLAFSIIISTMLTSRLAKLMKKPPEENKRGGGWWITRKIKALGGGIAGLATSIASALTYGGFNNYGAAMFAHTPVTGLKRFLSPANAGKIVLGNQPDVLIASAHGDVDIIAKENIHTMTDGEIHTDGKKIFINAEEVSLTGIVPGPTAGNVYGHVAINEGGTPRVVLEMKPSKITLDETTGIDQTTGAESIKLNLHAPYEPDDIIGTIQMISPNFKNAVGKHPTAIIMENETCLVELDSGKKHLGLGVRENKDSKSLAHILMELSEKSIEIKADKTIDIKAPTVNVGPDSKKMTIGNSNTDMTLLGKKAKWKAAKVNIG